MKSDTHTTAEFDQLVQKTIEDWKVPGVSIAIVHKDEIFVKVFPLLNLNPKYSVVKVKYSARRVMG